MRILWCFILLMCSTIVYADSSYEMRLKYIPEEQVLVVGIERFAEDEMAHLMTKLIVYRNGEEYLQEPMVSHNHFSQVEKRLPLPAKDDDLIGVELYYGTDSVLQESMVVGVSTEAEPETMEAETSIPEKEIFKLKEKPEEYGYEDPGVAEGQEGYGYEETNTEPYGYTRDDKKEEIKRSDSYGYKADHKPIGESGYGYKREDDQGEKNSYGRREY